MLKSLGSPMSSLPQPLKRLEVRAGFSLIEVLVAVSVVASLAAILLGVFVRARRGAQASVCLSNLHQTVMATELYRSDNDDQLPPQNPGGQVLYGPEGRVSLTKDILDGYGTNRTLYDCPAISEENGKPRVEYLFRYVLDFSELRGGREWSWRLIPNPSTVLAWDWNHTSYRANFIDPRDIVLFARADGSVGRVAHGNLERSYWVNGAWTMSAPANPRSVPYQYVFPGEEWPPGMVEQP